MREGSRTVPPALWFRSVLLATLPVKIGYSQRQASPLVLAP